MRKNIISYKFFSKSNEIRHFQYAKYLKANESFFQNFTKSLKTDEKFRLKYTSNYLMIIFMITIYKTILLYDIQNVAGRKSRSIFNFIDAKKSRV